MIRGFAVLFLFVLIIGAGGMVDYYIVEYFDEQSSIINALGIGLICASVVCAAFWLWLIVAKWLCPENR